MRSQRHAFSILVLIVEPQRLLGLSVIDPDGTQLGRVVDVGLHDGHRPKFLLVQGAGPDLVQVDCGRITRVEGETIRVTVPLGRGMRPG